MSIILKYKSSTDRCRFLARRKGEGIQESGVKAKLRLDWFCFHDQEGYGQRDAVVRQSR